MKKRAAPRAASRNTPRTRKATATKAPAKKAATGRTTKPSTPSGHYTPPEVQGTGWAPFRYPPQ